ncbi:hypothetical protein BS47DRAFT_28891 [Hydnum rufescens UP504]|uniref:DNA2/NAM7 helicase-like C-terminal domain-containing protein n=1 Tax=Hydnum rufescens UP504 TaxID=1448309 RepID=A0A9P6B7U4_9AGAM|nr:hypothetical protein BS47DRAFT_28891 [Hydnum rufescens UP504]
MIVAMVQWLTNNGTGSEPPCCYLVSRSEPGIKNIAEALESSGFHDYRVAVSDEKASNWGDGLQGKIIEVGQVPQTLERLRGVFGSSCVVLCTLSTLIGLAGSTLTAVLMPPGTMICDDANQIPLSVFVPVFQKFGFTLSRVCFLGDDQQSSPYGEYSSRIATIFDMPHLRRNATVLKLQYRMSMQIGTFISCSLYNEVIESRRPDAHTSCVQFVHVPGEQVEDGISLLNPHEVDAVLDCARQFEMQSKQYKIVTGYSAQGTKIEDALKQAGLAWSGLVHTLETIQGTEADYIIISLVQTRTPGFLNDPGSTNVISTRCRLGLVVVCNGVFLMEDPFAKTTLLASMAEAWGNDWIPCDVLKSGVDLFPEDLPSEPNNAQENLEQENDGELDVSSDTPGSETYFENENENQDMSWPEDLQPTWF